MTPKEKAIELYNKYARFWHDTNETCKSQCLIAVDEILGVFRDAKLWNTNEAKFWQQVKEEITKL
jgi:hypothetical protein